MVSEGVDLLPACTDAVLSGADPKAADALGRDIATGRTPPDAAGGEQDPADAVHAAMAGVLPGGFTVTDRSTATICPRPGAAGGGNGAAEPAIDDGDLPGTLTPILRTARFDRDSRRAVQDITRALTDDTIEEIAAEVRAEDDLRGVVGRWYAAEVNRNSGSQHG